MAELTEMDADAKARYVTDLEIRINAGCNALTEHFILADYTAMKRDLRTLQTLVPELESLQRAESE